MSSRRDNCELQTAVRLAVEDLKKKVDDADVKSALTRIVDCNTVWPKLESALKTARNTWAERKPKSNIGRKQQEHELRLLKTNHFAARLVRNCARPLIEYKQVKILPPRKHERFYSHIALIADEISVAMKQDANFSATTAGLLYERIGLRNSDSDFSRYPALVLESIVAAANRMGDQGPLSDKPGHKDAALGYFIKTFAEFMRESFGKPLNPVVAKIGGAAFHKDVTARQVERILERHEPRQSYFPKRPPK